MGIDYDATIPGSHEFFQVPPFRADLKAMLSNHTINMRLILMNLLDLPR